MNLRETGEFIGIPAMLDVTALGFSVDPIPFLNYFIPISRIYNLLDGWERQYVYDSSQTYVGCEARRKEKQDALLRAWEVRWKQERNIVEGAGSDD